MHIINDDNHELTCIVYFVNTHNEAFKKGDQPPLQRWPSAVEVTEQSLCDLCCDPVHLTIYARGTFLNLSVISLSEHLK